MRGKAPRFVEEYLVDLNGAQAAIRAGYSAKCAHVMAAKLLARPDVQEAVRLAKAKLAERAELRAEDVVREARRIAFADLRDFATWGGTEIELKPSATLPNGSGRAIAAIGAGRHGPSIRLHDKIKALEMLMRYLGIADGAGAEAGGNAIGDLVRTLKQSRERAEAEAEGE